MPQAQHEVQLTVGYMVSLRSYCGLPGGAPEPGVERLDDLRQYEPADAGAEWIGLPLRLVPDSAQLAVTKTNMENKPQEQPPSPASVEKIKEQRNGRERRHDSQPLAKRRLTFALG